MDNYEFWPEGSVVPGSACVYEKEDAEKNILIGVTLLSSAADEYVHKSRNAGFPARIIRYNAQKFREDQVNRGKIENAMKLIQKQLKERIIYCFSNTFSILMHLKVMRVFVDGVLRFGIPPQFYLGIVQPSKNKEKALTGAMISTFADG